MKKVDIRYCSRVVSREVLKRVVLRNVLSQTRGLVRSIELLPNVRGKAQVLVRKSHDTKEKLVQESRTDTAAAR